MIYSILENSINSALELDENFDENGNINWDYIHADAYADVRSFFKDDETFNEFFGIKHDDAAVDDIVKAVKSYNGDMATDYETLKSKLIHNRKRYFEFVDEQKNLI